MIKLDIQNKIKCVRNVVKYSRLYHGEPIFYEIECTDEAELTAATTNLDNKLITHTTEALTPTAAELALENTVVRNMAEALARVAGTYKPPVTMADLQSKNEINQNAILELATMISGGVK
ncbi:MAG: hypothetical protein RSB38_01295 [Oscillospiraceae bacterium]